ncbi:MAG: hypothetical protein J6K46_08930 [Sutterella sp.]|nr:hypothetical protein [Sutterella sp.]
MGSLRYPVCPGPFEAELPGSSVGVSGEEGPGAGEGGSAGGSGSGGEGNGSGSGGGDAPVYGSPTEQGRDKLKALADQALTWEQILKYAETRYEGWNSSETDASLIKQGSQLFVMLNKQNVSKSAPQDINKAAENYHITSLKSDLIQTVRGAFSLRTASGIQLYEKAL